MRVTRSRNSSRKAVHCYDIIKVSRSMFTKCTKDGLPGILGGFPGRLCFPIGSRRIRSRSDKPEMVAFKSPFNHILQISPGTDFLSGTDRKTEARGGNSYRQLHPCTTGQCIPDLRYTETNLYPASCSTVDQTGERYRKDPRGGPRGHDCGTVVHRHLARYGAGGGAVKWHQSGPALFSNNALSAILRLLKR